MGRPVDWTDEKIAELVTQLEEYIDKAAKRTQTKHVSKKGYILIEPPDFPSIQEFCGSGTSICNSKYIYDLAQKHQSLSDMMQRLKDLQAQFILTNTMSRKYSDRMSIFVMQNITGWREKQQVEQTGEAKVMIVERADKNTEKEPDVRSED